MLRIFTFLFCITLLSGCGKELLLSKHSEFVGNWISYNSDGLMDIIVISNKGTGSANIDNSLFADISGPIDRQWYIKDDYLFLGYFKTKKKGFRINVYPTTATETVTYNGFKIYPNTTYIVLDDVVYIK